MSITKKELDKLKKDAEKVKKEIEQLEPERDALKEEIEKLQEEINNFQENNKEQLDQIAENEQKLLELENQKEEIQKKYIEEVEIEATENANKIREEADDYSTKTRTEADEYAKEIEEVAENKVSEKDAALVALKQKADEEEKRYLKVHQDILKEQESLRVDEKAQKAAFKKEREEIAEEHNRIASEQKELDEKIVQNRQMELRLADEKEIQKQGYIEEKEEIQRKYSEIINKNQNIITELRAKIDNAQIDLMQQFNDELLQHYDDKKEEVLNKFIDREHKLNETLNAYEKKFIQNLDEAIKNVDKLAEDYAKKLVDLAKLKSDLEIKIAENAAEAEANKVAKEAFLKRKDSYNAVIEAEVNKQVEAEKVLNAPKIALIEQLQQQNEQLIKEKNELENDLLKFKTTDVTKLTDELDRYKDKLKEYVKKENDALSLLHMYKYTEAELKNIIDKSSQYDALLSQYDALLKERNELRDINNANTATERQLQLKDNTIAEDERTITMLQEHLARQSAPSREDRLSSFNDFYEFDKYRDYPYIKENVTELQWLNIIHEQMESSQIFISQRLLYAFHTSVKIHDWSPLVVLAGVSGTGKSELPRQYATHGGMNFISIPVKPDWDSMESLFGYYNSIENKFEPTELAKAIYYFNSQDELKNNVLLVLLDEMNLAHVELYFSDLLSKFETNRGSGVDNFSYLMPLGAKEDPEELKITKNILWVGTMNEDETTKALSDKVIDRSTLITFPRPLKLKSRSSDVKIKECNQKLNFNIWKKWVNNSYDENLATKNGIDIDNDYKTWVEQINGFMSGANRNLGHRVWQSIEYYMFSHPTVSKFKNSGILSDSQKDELVNNLNKAFAEAVAFKIMPKLRGIEVSGKSKETLLNIQDIIKNKCVALKELTQDFEKAMSLNSKIFQWSSAMFMENETEVK